MTLLDLPLIVRVEAHPAFGLGIFFAEQHLTVVLLFVKLSIYKGRFS